MEISASSDEMTELPVARQAIYARACLWVFAIYIALVPAMRFPRLELHNTDLILADFVFVICGLFFVLALLRGELRWRLQPFHVALCLYGGAMLVSAFAARSRGQSLWTLLIEGYVLAIGIVTSSLCQLPGALRLITRAWMAGTALTALAGLSGVTLFLWGVRGYENPFLSGYGSLPPGSYPRTYAMFLNINMCCSYLSVSLLLLLAMQSLGWIGRRSAWILGSAIVFTAIFTFSPGLGGVALGVGFWFFLEYRRRLRPNASSAMLIGASAVSIAFLVAVLVSPTSLYKPGLGWSWVGLQPSGRLLCWESAARTVANN